MPIETLWEQKCGNDTEIANFEDLENFLESRFRALESIERKQYRQFNNRHVKTHVGIVNEEKKGLSCPICKSEYSIFTCRLYTEKEPPARLLLIQKHRLCTICLRPHATRDCKTNWSCYTCKGRHNTSLHIERKTAAIAKCNQSDVLLATAVNNVLSADGRSQKYRALIDQGSMTTFVSEKVIQQLNISRDHDSTLISGIGGRTQKCNGSTSLHFQSIHNNKQFTTHALILNKLTSWLPSVDEKFLVEYQTYKLADPHFNIGSKIDIILGADVYKNILLNEVRKGSLLAQKTHLGWILSGALNQRSNKSHGICLVSTSEENASLINVLQQFWETEEKINPVSNWSAEENECEQFYSETTRRDHDGRYICRLPFKKQWKLGRSKHIAVANFLQLEKKFKNNPEFKEKYINCMREYLELGHARPAKKCENYFIRNISGEKNYVCFYIPHLAVMKESSTTTKTRVVFNASSKSSNGNSLNDYLLIGPVIQRDIVEKINRFRMYKIVFVCDVEKMYRQIKMHTTDWDFQRFVWRESEQDTIQDYCLTTVTFGEASAPFTATRTLNQICRDSKDKFPKATKILNDECYVDDIHYGTNEIEQAIEGRNQLTNALSSAGFELRKWSSNCEAVLEDIRNEYIEKINTQKFMGIMWSQTEDEFSYGREGITTDEKLTKRKLLMEIAKIFDPMGWIQPIIITAKILMQLTWKSEIGWDEELSEDLSTKWIQCRDSLNDINSIKIPRWIQFSNSIRKIELHGFSDASQIAYGAVIYSRIILQNHTVKINMIMAKSRVAPL